ncbi:MAG: hypothetical protein ACI91F_003614 [Candidatus Binatia bacterium]|jgi:hypothetical protein
MSGTKTDDPQENPVHRALAAATRRALRPLVRLFLTHGLPFKAFAEIAKEVFTEAADEDFAIDGRRSTDARISVLTGLTRKDVRRLRKAQTDGSPDPVVAQFNRAARVTTAWVREQAYHRADGSPAALPFDGATPCFSELVRSYSGDMPARAVFDELLRVGAVVENRDGRIELAARGYVPRGDEISKLGILGEDLHTLAATIEHNMDPDVGELWFQRKVAYDNLPAEALEGLRQSAGRRGQKLLEKLDAEISPHDRDMHPDLGGSGRKQIVVGVYYWEGDAPDEEKSK